MERPHSVLKVQEHTVIFDVKVVHNIVEIDGFILASTVCTTSSADDPSENSAGVTWDVAEQHQKATEDGYLRRYSVDNVIARRRVWGEPCTEWGGTGIC